MRRDNDLLRVLILEMEENRAPLCSPAGAPSRSEEEERVDFHLRLLSAEAFLEETVREGGIVFRMTDKGHELAVTLQSENIWDRTKAAAAVAPVDVSISALMDIALGLIRQELAKHGLRPR